MAKDMVNAPSHYQGPIQCITAIKAMVTFWTDPVAIVDGAQVLKYLWRHPHKGNPIQDLEKAEWYLHDLINHLKEKEQHSNENCS